MGKITPQPEKQRKTVSDYLPNLFDTKLLYKPGVVITEATTEKIQLDISPPTGEGMAVVLEYSKCISHWNITIDVWIVDIDGEKRTRLVVNGEPDEKVIRFWGAALDKVSTMSQISRDETVGRAFTTLREVLKQESVP